MRGESRKVLPGTRPQGPTTAPGTRLQPGRHDFLWFLSAPLAADRGREADHGSYYAANLQGVWVSDGKTCPWSG